VTCRIRAQEPAVVVDIQNLPLEDLSSRQHQHGCLPAHSREKRPHVYFLTVFRAHVVDSADESAGPRVLVRANDQRLP
jgi:hypothetical protein